VSSMKYELGFYIPEDGMFQSQSLVKNVAVLFFILYLITCLRLSVNCLIISLCLCNSQCNSFFFFSIIRSIVR
jgi:hypothetical protein